MRGLSYLPISPLSVPTAFESADTSCSTLESDSGYTVIMERVEVMCGAASAGKLLVTPG